MVVTQKNRKVQVSTPLAEDTLLFYQMYGRESLSEPFEYNFELVSEDRTIDPDKILGEPIAIKLQLEDGNWRYFNGFVSRFGQYGELNGFTRYRATIRPWLWFLTRTSNCRIFQNKTIPEIIRQVFQDHGFTDFKEKLSGNYTPREYCVQYRETDFNLVSRLMEEEGIYYYFTHEKDKHNLILVDLSNTHDPFPGYENIPYHVDTGTTDRSRKDHIHAWSFTREVQPGAYELIDYDFKKPKANLLVKSILKNSHSQAQYAFFDYHPGRYTEANTGDNFVRQRIEEHHARFERYEGRGNARGLATGYRFNLKEFPLQDQNCEYLVVSANYHLLLDEYASGSGISGEEKLFDCSFTVQDNKRPYRPARSTPKPFVHGSQTAVVTGPAGEEIHTDKFGRVKVQFHWDRYGNRDQDSSCWIRVSQPWAGKNWGTVAIPRIGQEVIVDFLEGDPDQPIIIGNVYNADVMPPYSLPGGAVISGMKSNTHKGQGYNEMSMDDTAGNEKITIHGQYDMNTTVQHDQTNTVGHDQTNTVNNNFTEVIKNNASITITEGTYSHDVKANTATYHAKGDVSENYESNQTTTVTANQATNVGSNQTTTVGQTITVQSQSANIKIAAATSILLEVGASSIYMDSTGNISINGVNVAINAVESVSTSGNAIRSEALNEHEIKGAIVKSEGSATNTVTGAMVMLNP